MIMVVVTVVAPSRPSATRMGRSRRLALVTQAAADDGDGGGHRAVLADDLLHVQGSLHVLGIGHTVRDDGGFQSHHGTALLQGLLHFGSDVQIFVQRHVEFLHKIEI